MSQNFLISVIVPAYNAAPTIAETLASIAAQTYRNIEIIIVDDGSGDETAAVARQFCGFEPRARLIRQQNGGVASARNRAIAAARGEFIAPIDADDIWHPTKLEKQLDAMLAAPAACGFVYALYRIIDQESAVVWSSPLQTCQGYAFRQHLFRNFVGNGSSPLMRRSAVVEAGGYDARLRGRGAQGCEDLLLQLKIARRWPVAVVPEYLVGYRSRDGSMSSNEDTMLRSWLIAMEIMRGECPDLPRSVFDWSIAAHRNRIARRLWSEGRILAAAGHVASGFRGDPVTTALWLTLEQGIAGVQALRALLAGERVGRSADWARDRGRFCDLDPARTPWCRRRDPLERRLERLRAADAGAWEPVRAAPARGLRQIEAA